MRIYEFIVNDHVPVFYPMEEGSRKTVNDYKSSLRVTIRPRYSTGTRIDDKYQARFQRNLTNVDDAVNVVKTLYEIERMLDDYSAEDAEKIADQINYFENDCLLDNIDKFYGFAVAIMSQYPCVWEDEEEEEEDE